MTEIKHKILGTVGTVDIEEPKKMATADLKSLIELGCIKDTVEIEGFAFTMKSLGATERLELSKKFGTGDLSGEEQFDFNNHLLAMAIESVNGQPLEILHPREQDPFKARIEIISALQSPVINKLLEFYAGVMNRCDSQFELEQIKN